MTNGKKREGAERWDKKEMCSLCVKWVQVCSGCVWGLTVQYSQQLTTPITPSSHPTHTPCAKYVSAGQAQ